jgi:hypothetical protein
MHWDYHDSIRSFARYSTFKGMKPKIILAIGVVCVALGSIALSALRPASAVPVLLNGSFHSRMAFTARTETSNSGVLWGLVVSGLRLTPRVSICGR